MNATQSFLLPLFVATLVGETGIVGALANVPPTLSPNPNVTINEDAGSQTVSLSGIGPGAGDENQTLTITAVSSNPSLIPNPAITYTSPNATGSLSFTPVVNAFGIATITVIVNDGQPSDNTVVRSFMVTVVPVNDLPAVSAITDRSMNENTATTIPFAISDMETPASSLTVAASSSNPTLVPSANLLIGGSGANRVLTIVPTANQFGTAVITLTVTDAAGGATSRSFTLTVNTVVRIARAANNAMVSWTATNGVLQYSDEASGLWEDMVPEPRSPYVTSPTGKKFYRLRPR